MDLYKPRSDIVESENETKYTELEYKIEELEKYANALNERVKELTCLHEATRLLASNMPIDEIFQNLVAIMQSAWQYPDLTCIRAEYLHTEYETPNYQETTWNISEKIIVSKEIIGELTVGFLGDSRDENENPFLKEEIDLLVALSEKLGGYLERKIAQQALSFSEQKYRSLVETAPSVIVLLSGDGKIRELNQEAERVFGYSLQKVIGMNYLDLFVPRDWHDRLEQHFSSIITGDFNQGFEYPIVTRDGSIRHFIWNASLVIDQGGQPSILGIGQDITKRKNTEDALIESEERYRNLFDNLADGIAIVDTKGIITMCNDRLLNIFGFTADETIGKSFTEFLHPDYRETVFKEFLEGFNLQKLGGEGLEVLATGKSGESFFINVSNTVLYENGKPTGYQSVIRDIPKEKLSEKAILEERDRAQRYLDIAGAAIVVLNNDGIVQQINQKGSEILGYPIDEIVGKDWFEHFIPGSFRSSIRQVFADLLDGNSQVLESSEIPILTSEGIERIIEWRNSVIRNSEGEAIGTMSSGVDVTERKFAEENMKNAADTAMLYLDIMGHDIRNHLQAIVMGTDIMGHYELGAEIETIFELIVDSVENSQKLIDQVQATRELLSTPLEKITLWRILSLAIDNVQTEFPDVIFKSEIDTNTNQVLADEYLRILCCNLLNNAITHNQNKDRKVWVSLSEVSEGYVVTIEDNGPGISDERKESLFDAGRRFGGIGIHQAKSIVEKYGGFISVNDRVKGDPNQGASFSFWIPKSNGDFDGGLPF